MKEKGGKEGRSTRRNGRGGKGREEGEGDGGLKSETKKKEKEHKEKMCGYRFYYSPTRQANS